MEEKLLGSLVLLVLPGNREGDTLEGKREGEWICGPKHQFPQTRWSRTSMRESLLIVRAAALSRL